MSLIEITEVRKSFGSTEVLKGINLDVEPGEVIAIIGSLRSRSPAIVSPLRWEVPTPSPG